MKTKIVQILYDMRHQPVIAWVTFIATALSVFLIMVVVMMQRVKTVPFSPESCRDRLLVGAFMHIVSTDDTGENSSSSLSYNAVKTLYDNLDGVERTSYFHLLLDDYDVKGAQTEAFSAKSRKVDAEFFEIFDHPLVQGRYFTADEANSMLPVTVISEKTARQAIGDNNWIGSQLLIDQKPYTVVEVVRDNSSLATVASGDVFLPTGPNDTAGNWTWAYGDYFGSTSAALLVKDGVDFQSVRDQVKARYAIIDTELAPHHFQTI